MDSHLNLFNSYSRGDDRDSEGTRALENNVTRAFVAMLRFSPLEVTRQLLASLAGLRLKGAGFLYDLQRPKLPELQALFGDPACRKIILGIAPLLSDSEIPFPVALERAAGAAIHPTGIPSAQETRRASRASLRRTLDELRHRLENSDDRALDLATVRDKLAAAFGVAAHDLAEIAEAPELLESQLGYIDDLLRDGIPDAWIGIPGQALILIENKIHGGLVAAQLARHRNTWFPTAGEDFAVVQKTWTDVYNALGAACPKEPASSIFVRQFLEFLERLGLGPLAVARDVFQSFDKKDDTEATAILRAAEHRLRTAGASLLPVEEPSFLKPCHRHFKPDYIGIEMLDRADAGKKPYGTIHLSVGIDAAGLHVYVVVEPKQLVRNLVAAWRSDKLGFEAALGTQLQSLRTLSCTSVCQAKVTLKMFFARGFQEYRPFPPESLRNNPGVAASVMRSIERALDAPEGQAEFRRRFPGKYRTRSIHGTLVVEYLLAPETVSAEGTRIAGVIREATGALSDLYGFLRLKCLGDSGCRRGKTPRTQ